MRRVVVLSCVLALGGCASLEGGVREQRPEQEPVEASVSSDEERDLVSRQQRREYAEVARALEISQTREKAWAALDADVLEEAAAHVKNLAALGAPSGDLLRRMAAMHLSRARRAFDDALRDGEPELAEKILVDTPVLRLEDPTLGTRAEIVRYEKLLPIAAQVERLARSGRVDEARAERRKLVEGGGEPVLIDLAKVSRRRSEELVEKGKFAAAWRESWSLRETESVAAEKFVARFGVLRWRHEGIGMTRAQLDSFVDDLGDQAPAQATRRLALFRLLDETAAGRSVAATKAMGRIGEDLRAAVLRCNEANGDLPAPADEFSLGEMPAALEYMAQRVPTQKQRAELRRTRDEGRELLRKVMQQREQLHDLVQAAERCEGGVKELAWYEGAPPGSEGYAKSLAAAKRTHACLWDLVKRVDSFQRQGETCVRYLEKASTALQGAFGR